MLSVGVLPALEQLFRQLPVVSPAHVTAATFLVSLAAVGGVLLQFGGSGSNWPRQGASPVVAVAARLYAQ
jgi:hypothetical protein